MIFISITGEQEEQEYFWFDISHKLNAKVW